MVSREMVYGDCPTSLGVSRPGQRRFAGATCGQLCTTTTGTRGNFKRTTKPILGFKEVTHRLRLFAGCLGLLGDGGTDKCNRRASGLAVTLPSSEEIVHTDEPRLKPEEIVSQRTKPPHKVTDWVDRCTQIT